MINIIFEMFSPRVKLVATNPHMLCSEHRLIRNETILNDIPRRWRMDCDIPTHIHSI
jgi:hypothetical protein